jgi:hypothetical protein
MPAPWTKVAVWSAVLLAVASTSAGAEPAGPAAGQGSTQTNVLCGEDQLAGQYECVRSVLLSDEEVRINMAYLASFGPRHAPARADESSRFAAGGVAIPARNTSEAYYAQACGADYVCDQDGAPMRPR